jgi:nucleotide-binding universal stress UspA family protein
MHAEVEAATGEVRLVGSLQAPEESGPAPASRGDHAPAPYRSICVPLDGSPASECALPLARALGRRLEARLCFVHVHKPGSDRPYTGRGEYARRENELRCEESRYLWSKINGDEREPAAASILMAGRIPDALLRFAREKGTDLAVLTAHGAGGAGHPWLGSVADRLIRSAPVPVLLVPVTDVPPAGGRGPLLRSVLVPLDGSSAAEEVLEHALALGGLFGASYTLVRVEPPASHQATTEAAHDTGVQPGTAAQRYLEYVAERLRRRGVTVAVRVVVDARPAEAILGLAQEMGADLVALTLHGEDGRQRRLLGSVADKVIRAATTTLLLYRPRGGRFAPASG